MVWLNETFHLIKHYDDILNQKCSRFFFEISKKQVLPKLKREGVWKTHSGNINSWRPVTVLFSVQFWPSFPRSRAQPTFSHVSGPTHI